MKASVKAEEFAENRVASPGQSADDAGINNG
jgi:hypothetical protein